MWYVISALVVTGAACMAQTSVPVEIALAGVRDAYRTGPVADRVVVTITDERGSRAIERVTVRLDATAESPIVALDLGRLRVSATRGRLNAVHDAEATTCFSTAVDDPITSASLFGVLPPVPVPQIALALDDDAALETVYCPAITWLEAEIHDARQLITMTGRGTEGDASAVIDATTGRLRRFESDIAQGVLRLTLDMTPADAGPTSSWAIPVGARRHVARLGDLTRPPRDLGPGDPAPNVRAISLPSTSWSLHEAAGSSPVGMLVFRVVPPGARADQVHRDILAARDRVIAMLDETGIDDFSLVAVGIVEQLDLDLIESLRIRWATELDDVRVDRSLPWTQDAGRAIDAFDPDADALLVVVDTDLRVADVIRLDGQSDALDALDEAIRRALGPYVPPEPEESVDPDSVLAPPPAPF